VWRELAELNYLTLRSLSELAAVPDKVIAFAAVALVYQLARDFGGNAVYIAKGSVLRSAQTAAEIVNENRGNNTRAIAKKHNLTQMRVRQIIKLENDSKRSSGNLKR
jgi:Mor family transcriptional regulator